VGSDGKPVSGRHPCVESGGNMLAKMLDILRVTGRKNQKPGTGGMPELSAGEQTKLTWARVIVSYDSVPEAYKGFFAPLLASGQVFPYTVLAPAFETFGYRITEKLVCALDREIHVLERNGNTFKVQSYPLDGISHVVVKTILLDSRIKISGVTKQGVPTSSTVRFNSVTDYLFTPILRRIRLKVIDSRDVVGSLELSKFDQWIKSNFKFMNFARHSLLGGEKVIHTMLQPEIRASRFTLLGRTFYKTISPTHVCILTDRELIMIQEEAIQGRKDKYGGTWDYIPLNKITALTLNTKDDNLLTLSIQLPENEQFEYLFQVSMKVEVDQLLDRFRELTSG
jgi:hypothetical protein